MKEEQLLDVLELISENDGTYGWYQLDRALVRSGHLGLHVGQALEVLLSRGLVRVEGDPKVPSARYHITDDGTAALCRRTEERAHGR